jgi:DNA-binding transcriptional MerR regulator
MTPGPRESRFQPPELPDKPYLRIGEVAKLLGVETHVIRFWEGELPGLEPTRAPSGRRIYRAGDVHRLALVRHLLYEEGYTIAGARRRLAEMAARAGEEPAPAQDDKGAILGELKDILKLLK